MRRATVFLKLLLTVAVSTASYSLPSYFDLRDCSAGNCVTSVKSQIGGTCWTHGSMAAIEGNLLMTNTWADNGEIGEPDLAEYHLDWWNGFNQHNNDDTDPPQGGGLTVHQGGDYRVTAAYLARLEGAVRDGDGQSYSEPPLRSSETYHYYYPRHIEWLEAGDELQGIDLIKQQLMDNGVMGTCLASSGQFIDSNFVHYQPGSSQVDPNHAVAIVGWWDDLPTAAPKNGGWICKNSWGEGWGLEGFFYISYYDKHAGHHPEMGAVSFRGVEPLRYTDVYYHDYHGWRDEMDGVSRALNVFTAGDDHLLESVSFVIPSDSLDYTVRVWNGFDGAPSTLLTETSGTFARRGLHTVDLDEPQQLFAGEVFCLELELSQPGMPYDRTSVVPVLLGADTKTLVESSAAEGQSYYYQDGEWKDLYYWDGNPYPGTGNFCMKALVTEYGLTVSGPEEIYIEGPEGGPFLPMTHRIDLLARSSEPLNYMARLEPGVSWLQLYGNAQGTLYPYESEDLVLSVDESAFELESGAYTTVLTIEDLSAGTVAAELSIVLLVGDSTVTAHSWSMDQDPGWSRQGAWEWGAPQGQGGEHGNPDPSSGWTGTNVIGYNHQGDYTNYMDQQCLTAGPLDCSDLYRSRLEFRRWLNVQQGWFDEACLLASSDGQSWSTVWSNAEEKITDSSWVAVSYDISQIADGNSTVYIRWTMGPTNMGWTYSGWNIDDVAVVGLRDDGEGGLLSAGLILNQSCPNPMRGSAELSFEMPAADHVKLTVYDISGRVVSRLVDGTRTAGSHSAVWDGRTGSGRQAPSGVYFVELSGSHSRDTIKLVRL